MRIAKRAALLLAFASVACTTLEPRHYELEGLGGIAVSGSKSSSSATPEATLDFPSAVAYGGDVNFRSEKWSVVFGVQFATANAEVQGTSVPLESGQIEVRPLEFLFQWHPLGLVTIDPYVGAGTAIVFPTDTELANADGSGQTATLHFEGTLALAADLGARFGLGPHFGLLVDAKYSTGNFRGRSRFRTSRAARFRTRPSTSSSHRAGSRTGSRDPVRSRRTRPSRSRCRRPCRRCRTCR